MAKNIHIKIEPDESPEHPWRNRDAGFEWNLQNDTSEEFPVGDTTDWWVFNVYFYKHGLTALSLKPFSCQWDSGLYGEVAVKRPSRGGRWYRRSKFYEELLTWLEDMVCWVNGDIHYYRVTDDDGNILDSCGGVYDLEYAKEVAHHSAHMFLAAIPPQERGEILWSS